MNSDKRSFPVTNLIGFFLILVIAWKLNWQTKDLVWSLWLGSLLLGTLSFLVTALAALIFVGKFLKPRFYDRHISKLQTCGAFGIAILVAAALLAFFCFHFCGFHSGHAVFLSMFFPLTENSDPGGFGDHFTNPIGLFKDAFTRLVPYYFWFLIPALILESRRIFSPLWLAVKTEIQPDLFKLEDIKEGKRPDLPISDPIMGPYKNVIRMHILIFFFFGCHLLKIENFIVYAVVYAVYFFPWSILKRNKEQVEAG